MALLSLLEGHQYKDICLHILPVRAALGWKGWGGVRREPTKLPTPEDCVSVMRMMGGQS